MSKYVCAGCGSPATCNHASMPLAVEYIDAENKRRTKMIYFDGLGTWRCPKGCRNKRYKTPVRRIK